MSIEELVFIAPCFNAALNLQNLFSSLRCQNISNWRLLLVDDLSEDQTLETANALRENDGRIEIIKNAEKKYALRNVVEQARKYQNRDDIVIGILDADDQLLGSDVVGTILEEYNKNNNLDTLWTKHSWNPGGQNISANLPDKVNPYQYQWVTSHLKTFRASLIKNVNEKNFLDHKGNFYMRGYDFVVYTPLLYKSRERKFLDKVCYQYNLHSVSIPLQKRNYNEVNQIQTINFVRARGFIE